LTAARKHEQIPDFIQRLSAAPGATACWEGFIFVNLSAHPQPFEHAFAPLNRTFSRWNVASLSTALRSSTTWLQLEARLPELSNAITCPLVHPQLDKLSRRTGGRNDLATGPFPEDTPNRAIPGGSLTTNGKSQRPPVGNVHGDNLNRIYYYHDLPSLLLACIPITD